MLPRKIFENSFAAMAILVLCEQFSGKILFKLQIKSSLYSPYYAEACNELRGPSPRLNAWATQFRRNVAAVASRWRHCADLTGPEIDHKHDAFCLHIFNYACLLKQGLLLSKRFEIMEKKNLYIKSIFENGWWKDA